MATSAQDISIFLDGKRRTLRTWSTSDAQKSPIMFASGGVGLDDATFAFTSVGSFEAWVQKNNLIREYTKGNAILERSPRQLSRQKQQQVSELQAKTVTQYGSELTALLRRSSIPIDDTKAVMTFLTNYDPLSGPLIHSALLFEHVNGTGQMRYLPKGWSWPNFSWLSFNDMCSSVGCFMGGIFLWEHTFYKGRAIYVVGYPGTMRNIGDYPWYFNDAASSAITF